MKLFLSFLVGVLLLGISSSIILAKSDAAPTMRRGETKNKELSEVEIAKQERETQRDNLVEFRKKQAEELKEKQKQVQEQRKACLEQRQELRKKRLEERKALQESCKPVTPSPSPIASRSARLEAIAAAKKAREECRKKVLEFDKETRLKLLEIQKSCFTQERSVLGLSTQVPFDQ